MTSLAHRAIDLIWQLPIRVPVMPPSDHDWPMDVWTAISIWWLSYGMYTLVRSMSGPMTVSSWNAILLAMVFGVGAVCGMFIFRIERGIIKFIVMFCVVPFGMHVTSVFLGGLIRYWLR